MQRIVVYALLLICSSIVASSAPLSEPRLGLAAATTDLYAFFAGGFNGSDHTSVVDIYNALTSQWSTAQLCAPRSHLKATAVGKFVVFGGGQSYNNQQVYEVVDTSTYPWTWSSAIIGAERPFQGAATAGPYALFAGGFNSGPTNAVDIFNSTTQTWSTSTLSAARYGLGATSNGAVALFAGGSDGSGFLNTVDIFNADTLQWSTSALSVGRTDLAATSVGKYALFAGGRIGTSPTDVVDIYNYETGSWSTAQLSVPRMLFAATTVGKYALLGGGCNYDSTTFSVVDIFDAEVGQWVSTTTLSLARGDFAATTVGRKALFGGGGKIDNSLIVDTVDFFSFDDILADVPVSPAAPNTSVQFIVKSNTEDYLVINSGNDVKTCGGVNICDEIAKGKQTLILNSNGQLSISNGNTVLLADNNATNEIQTLSLTGSTVSLTNGGSFVLPDASSTNELQTLSIVNKTLQLSQANSVPLPFVKMVSNFYAYVTASDNTYQNLFQSSVTLPSSGSVKLEFQCSLWCDLRSGSYSYCDHRFFLSDSATAPTADFDQSFVEVFSQTTLQQVISLSWVVQRPAGDYTFYVLGHKVDSAGTYAVPQGGIIRPRLIVTFFPE